MNLTLIHRHPCCAHRHAAAFHGGWLAGFLGIAALGASMFGVVQTMDQVVWGQAYKAHVVDGSIQAAPGLQTQARYASDTPATQFRPITDRIFGH
ncbi:MAG TPA: hypothetical protein VMW62_03085 [Chloroflexota bacterium]|nr:hypothetical protein [Chloroflexota bacterium]